MNFTPALFYLWKEDEREQGVGRKYSMTSGADEATNNNVTHYYALKENGLELIRKVEETLD